MEPLLWLLLPVAAASGWISSRISQRKAANGDVSAAASDQTRSYANQCIQGLNYLLSEQSDKAIQLLVEMVDVDEDTVETHLVLGSLFRRRGEVDRAIRIHQNVIARPTLSAAQRSSAMLQLGVDYLKAGLFDRAENILNQLADSQPDNPDVYRYLRQLYEQEKEWETAIKMAKRLHRVGKIPQNARIAHYYCELAEQHVRARRIDEAAEMVKKALATDPECIRAYIQAGDIEAAKGKTRAAIRAFRNALRKNRNFSPIVLKHLHGLFAREGLLEQLPDFIHQNADCRKDAAARYFLIKTYSALGETERVDELLHEELKRREASPHIIKMYIEKMRDSTEGEISESFRALDRVLNSRLSDNMACHCTRCGFESNSVFWQCPGCQSWGSVRPHQNPLEYSWLDS
ncbi:MAG TPA: lipopolysaccharide assembly protein LapB [Gammaproteobacteria bacterium]|nr:lipopolysaccharide assembly protein LapB [Gammaproteobacteria bacterium]